MNVYRLIFSRPPVKPERKVQTVGYTIHANTDRDAEVYIRQVYPGLSSYTVSTIGIVAQANQTTIIR